MVVRGDEGKGDGEGSLKFGVGQPTVLMPTQACLNFGLSSEHLAVRQIRSIRPEIMKQGLFVILI